MFGRRLSSGAQVTADQAASLFVFLCPDVAAQIKGANCSLDGGWTA
jgi:hypothetical protein